MKESVFVLNDIEKQIAEEFIRELSSGNIPVEREDPKVEVSYEYHANKNEKIVRGIVLGCHYRLKYRDSDHIFFSAWDCKDVCGVFYDMVVTVHILAGLDVDILDISRPFTVDLHTERYVFFTGDAAASFVSIADKLSKQIEKKSHDSQYILSVFEESDNGVYDVLIQQLKTEGYAKIQILQIWIRGEILYYAAVDGAVLRPEHQRTLTSKEEEDLIRKIYKAVNNKFHPVKFQAPHQRQNDGSADNCPETAGSV